MFTIPVIVDDIKSYPNFKMTRCNYFSIDGDDPLISWNLDTNYIANISVILTGFNGIISGYSSEQPEFKTVEEIEKTFNEIEDSEIFIVDINYLWLPSDLLGKNNEIENVFRIGENAFKTAYQFTHGKLQQDEFLRRINEVSGEVIFSEMETSAFLEWSNMQVENARFHYKSNIEQALTYRDK